MTVEETLEAIEKAEAALKAGDWDGFDAAHAESVVVYSPSTPESTQGRQAHREQIQGFATAIPDMKLERLGAFGAGEWVCAEQVMTGTNTGPLIGPDGEEIPATNKPVRLNILTVGKVVNGEIAEEHVYFDQLGFMAQLGLLPEQE